MSSGPFDNPVFIARCEQIYAEARKCRACHYNLGGYLCRYHFDKIIESIPGVHRGLDREGNEAWFGIGLKEDPQ